MNIVDLSPAYFPNPNTGIPIELGFVYVGEPDTDPTVVANQKDIFLLQENGTFVATAQPVTLGAGGLPTYNGSTVTIYVTGDYSIRVDDSSNAQIYYIPRTSAQEATGTQFPVWDIATTYAQNAYVTGSDDRLYYSIAGANLAKDPTSTTGFWQGFIQVGDDVVGDITGDVKSTDGTVVLNNGTNGTDATFIGDVTGDFTGDLTGDIYSQDGLVKVLENGPDGTGATFTGTATSAGTGDVNSAPGGDFSAGTIRYWKVGNQVTISWDGMTMAAASSGTTAVGAIPPDYLPPSNIYNTFGNNSADIFTVFLDASGALTLLIRTYTGANGSGTIFINGSVSFVN